MKRFVIGDIHGRVCALKEVLKKCKFDYEVDRLIVLGDIADGGYDTAEVIEELLKIKDLIYIIGNHDEWFMNHIKTGWADEVWIQQGGANTLRAYGAKVKEADYVSDRSRLDTRNLKIPVTHQHFFNSGKYYYILDNMAFVHGGFFPKLGPEKTPKEVLLWDRSLIQEAIEAPIPRFKKVFVGHTTTQIYGHMTEIKDCNAPIKFNNLIMMDTGAGWNGKLSIMDIDTEEFWVSRLQKPAMFRS